MMTRLRILVPTLFLALAVFTLAPGGNEALAQQQGLVPGGSLGNNSDSELWRAIRNGEGGLIVADGSSWRALRNGPMSTYAVWALTGSLIVLALFYIARGRIMISGGRGEETIERFTAIERFGHWLTAGSFVALAITGLNIMYGRYVLLPVIGPEAFSAISIGAKWIHNWIAFPFMAGLVLIFFMWVRHNIPAKIDIQWFLQGGGLLGGGHPPAKKFNGGQKIIFWLTILGGLSLSLSGWALLDPFSSTMFADTFQALNNFGFALPTDLSPMQEMQFSQLWHGMMSTFMIAVIIAHIYIGSLGMEGAFDAMGSGQVDLNWAKDHHSLWVEEVQEAEKAKASGGASGQTAPAE